MRKLAVLGIVVLLGLMATSAVFAAQKNIPVPVSAKQNSVDPFWDSSVPMVITKEAAPGDTVWVRVKDDSSCSYQPSDKTYGGRGEAAPSWATWCFDGGATDTCSNTTRYGAGLPGCWTHYDAHVFGQANRWHIDTFDEYDPPGGPNEDSTMWAGQLGDTLTWVFPPGYDDGWDYSLILDLGNSATFRTTNGMTIGGVHKYAVELAYDYCFMQMSASGTADTATWVEIARFNGVSDPDSTNCNGLGGAYWGTTGAGGIGTGVSPYLCATYKNFEVKVPAAAITGLGLNGTERLRVRWRVVTDPAWSDQDGSGQTPLLQQANTDGAWRVDHVYAKGVNDGTFNHYFPPLGATTRDPSIAAGNVDWELTSEDGRSQLTSPLLPIAQAPGGTWNGSSWVAGKATIVDFFHLTNTPLNYVNLGQTCETSNHWLWSSSKTAAGADGIITHNGWRFRLASPIMDVQPTSPLFATTILAGYTGGLGVYTTWDEYVCILESASEDVTDTNIRRYEGSPVNRWFDPEGDGFVIIGGCQNWTSPSADDWSANMTAVTDSIQILYEFWDQCNFNSASVEGCFPAPGFNPHRKAAYLIDNISVGFFTLNSTVWTADVQDIFQDTFAKDIYIHPTTKENGELKRDDVEEYEDLMTVTVSDNQGIAQNSIVMHYRISTDCGSSWSHECPAPGPTCIHPQGSKLKPTVEWFTKQMSFGTPLFPANPPAMREFDGDYQAKIDSADVAAVAPGMLGAGGAAGFWKEGTVIEYYLTSLDRGGTPVADTLPNRNAVRRTFIHRQWGTERQDPWPFEVTVLPCQPASAFNAQGSKKILLNNDFYLRNAYDAESDYVSNGTINIGTLSGNLTVENLPRMSQMYEEALKDLNVKFDRYDNNASQVSRGTNTPFYSEPTDADGDGGIRDASANHRYHTVIWATGDHRQYTVTDSSQLEVERYLASDEKQANLWLSGQNICEDEKMSGAGGLAFDDGDFWVHYIGAQLVTNECPDNGGLDSVNGVPGQNRVFYIEGVNDADFTALTLEGGYADCPDRDRPDEGLIISATGDGTETVIFQFDNKLHNLNNTAGLLNVQPTAGAAVNKMITTMFDLGTVTTRSARACITRAVLVEFGITLPAGSKYTGAICANGTTDVRPSTQNQFVLDQNYPNPFNPRTKITYALPKDNMKVELKIFDVSGREVTTLVNGVQGHGPQSVDWNGKNSQGHDVGSGVYFYRLNANELSATKKMVLLK